MPITRKRRAETIADNSPDRNVKRQSNRAKKNSNVNYNLDNYNEILEELEGSISQNDEEKSNPDRNVKRQSARVKNNNVKYTGRNYKAYTSQKNKEKSNFDPKNTTEKITEEVLKEVLNRVYMNRVENNNNVLASSQKYCLSDIFYDRCRPSWAQTNSESQKVYIIPRT